MVAPFESTVTFQPKPKGLEPFLGTKFTCFTGTEVKKLTQKALLVMRFDPNILRNPSFNEGRQVYLLY